MKSRNNIVISGGGTGGHLYPALSLGRALKRKDPSLHITFVGTGRDVERSILERQGVSFIPLKMEGLMRTGLRSIRSLFLLPSAFAKSLAILLSLRPKLVLGVGGYSSGPIVLLASLLRIPTLILEQNVRPGFTNRLLIPWVKKAVVSFKSSLSYFKGKGVFAGNPVREEFYTLRPKQRCEKLSILIFGGSQGSRFLNKGMTEALPYLKEEKEKMSIFHQTGEKDFKWVKEAYQDHDFEEVVISPYFFDIENYFEKADLIISRAGATTIAELIASQKASLLIPFAAAADNHQELNARELEKFGGADVLLEKEFSPRKIAEKIILFLRNREMITRMERNLARLKTDNAADKISEICLETIEISR
ncbi:MAG: undecaprenyldiphospho-muramoylpentapeptide beta-N-acetylglucosaminyltransferase [Candidatus Aminicenantales bacterium]